MVTVNLSPCKFFFHHQDLVPSAGELEGNATQVRLLNPDPGKAADTAPLHVFIQGGPHACHSYQIVEIIKIFQNAFVE